HRNDLLLAGCRQVADRGDQPARLSGAARRHAAARRRGDAGQPARRRHVRRHKSEDPPMTVLPNSVRAEPVEAAPNPSTSSGLTAPSPPGPWRAFWISFSANKGAVAGMAIVLGLLVIALIAPLLAPHMP